MLNLKRIGHLSLQTAFQRCAGNLSDPMKSCKLITHIVIQVVLFTNACGAINRLFAADWPQILGPNRNGQAAETELMAHWKPDQLTPKWSLNIGSGFAGAAIVDGKVLIAHRVGNSEMLQAVDLANGTQHWVTPWMATYASSINPDSGPRCVPTVAKGKVVCYGAAGDLVCANLLDGKVLWRLQARREYQAEDGYFGAGSSPLVINNVVIVNVGGQLGGIVGLDLDTGAKLWTATNHDASYASPIQASVQGKVAAIVVTRLHAVVLDPTNGKILGEISFGSRGPTVNAATPIPIGSGKYFLTASYGVGATLLDTSSGSIEQVYRGDEVLSSQYNTPVQIGPNLIGVDGREDMGSAALKAFDPLTRKEIWRKENLGTAHLIAVGQKVLVLGLDGSVRLIDGTANEYRELAVGSLPQGTYRAIPALAGKQLVVRDSRGDGTGKLYCIALP